MKTSDISFYLELFAVGLAVVVGLEVLYRAILQLVFKQPQNWTVKGILLNGVVFNLLTELDPRGGWQSAGYLGEEAERRTKRKRK